MTFHIITYLLVTLLATQKQPVITQIEFSKISRGYEEHIRISADSVNILVHDMKRDKPAITSARKMENKQWIALVDALSGVEISNIETLPSPTMNRTSDAALHGTITISVEGGQSYSHGFDDENPNDALKPVMKQIAQLRGFAKKQ